MLFAVDPERRRALQVGPFRGYDADGAGACVRATRNQAEFKQDAEGTGGGLWIERVRAGPGEGEAEVGTGELTACAEGFEDFDDDLAGGRLAGEDAERKWVLRVGEE